MRLLALVFALVAVDARAAALATPAIDARATGLTTPAIDGVVKAGTPIEIIGESFAGTEGPVALPDGSLLFTENRAARVARVAPDGSVEAFLTNAAGPNALALNAQGSVVATLTAQPGVAIIYPPERAATLLDQADRKPLNRPNDLVIDRAGGIYFTDPGGLRKPGQPEAAKAVYYFNARKELRLIDDSVGLPNGIQLSPDEKTLYVADTTGEYVLAYDVASEGVVSARRNFTRLARRAVATSTAAGADGLAVDIAGRLYVATSAGVQVFSAAGAALGVIDLPKKPQNLAFAGQNKHDLFVVGQGAVYRIHTRTQGVLSRAK
jgi:gluconolactonase